MFDGSEIDFDVGSPMLPLLQMKQSEHTQCIVNVIYMLG